MSTRKRCRPELRSSDVSPSDAFAVMMQQKQKVTNSRRAASSSAFVVCPAGCGKSFLERDINSHLDDCLNAEQNRIATSPPTMEKQSDQLPVENNSLKSCEVSCDSVSPSSDHQLCQEKPEVGDAFSLLLQNARKAASRKASTTNAERFHLHSDGRLSWEGVNTTNPNGEDIQWSASVSLKYLGSNTTDERRELIVSTSIPSLEQSSSPTRRLVRRHSRLSVPVLKSILQKAIRRRRPLPAAKVAMELVDKSFGDLLRRLPIVLLEDSTLHPDLPLLCWLMVAYSKDYVAPPLLITRVVQIVFEVASCPWTDCLEEEDDNMASTSLPTDDNPSNIDETILQSILLRASYGGMPGDVKMLIGYNQLWRERFASPELRSDISTTLKVAHASVSDDSNNFQLTWRGIPELIHQCAKNRSEIHVTPLVKSGIEKLLLSDICLEGVDFHCSSVLDHILADDVNDELYEHLATLEGIRPQAAKPLRRSWLESILKKCMWNYSSGVNHRRPIDNSAHKKESSNATEQLKILWEDRFAPKAREFMNRYIRERLA